MSYLFSDTIGGIPTDQMSISPARGMAKWNHNLRGVEIIQLGNTYPGMEVHCIETYLDIFFAGHTYVRAPLNDRWIDTTQKIHKHAAESDEDGGLYRNVLQANFGEYCYQDFDPMRISQWARYWEGETGGDSYNYEDGVELDTLNVAGNWTALYNGGNRVSFEHDMMWSMKYLLTTADGHSDHTSFRGGVNCEEVWETSNIRRMFGLEWCDDNGEDRTYMFFSSDGSERNAIVTSKSANNDAQTFRSFRIHLVSGVVLKLTWEGTDVIATKGSNVPRSLATSAVHKLKFGLKTVENSPKLYQIRSCRFLGKFSDLTPW